MTQQYIVNDNQWPYQAVAYIVTKFPNNSFSTGSGFLIGQNDLLTAAHVIYDKDKGGWATSINVRFSYNGVEQQNHIVYTPVHYVAYTNWQIPGVPGIVTGDGRAKTWAGSEQDIAFLTFDRKVGNIFGWFGIDYNFKRGVATSLGYPAFDRFGYQWARVRKYEIDPVDNFLRTTNREDGWQGISGGPVVIGNDRYVVGINSSSAGATSLSGHRLFIDSFREINDSFLTAGLDVFRFYNSRTGHHFYTTSVREAIDVVFLPDFRFESISFGVRAGGGDTAVHRLYNNKSGRHFFTMSEQEARSVDARPEWDYEGIAFHAYAKDAPGRVAVHRFWNGASGAHFYTADQAEAQSLVSLSLNRAP